MSTGNISGGHEAPNQQPKRNFHRIDPTMGPLDPIGPEKQLMVDRAKLGNDERDLERAKGALQAESAAEARAAAALPKDQPTLNADSGRLNQLLNLLQVEENAGASPTVVADIKNAIAADQQDIRRLDGKTASERRAVFVDGIVARSEQNRVDRAAQLVGHDERNLNRDQKVLEAFAHLGGDRAAVRGDQERIGNLENQIRQREEIGNRDRTALANDEGKLVSAKGDLKSLNSVLAQLKASGASPDVIAAISKAITDQEAVVAAVGHRVSSDNLNLLINNIVESGDRRSLDETQGKLQSDEARLGRDQKTVKTFNDRQAVKTDRKAVRTDRFNLGQDIKHLKGDTSALRRDQADLKKQQDLLSGLNKVLSQLEASGASSDVLAALQGAVAAQKNVVAQAAGKVGAGRVAVTRDQGTVYAAITHIVADQAKLKQDLAALAQDRGRAGGKRPPRVDPQVGPLLQTTNADIQNLRADVAAKGASVGRSGGMSPQEFAAYRLDMDSRVAMLSQMNGLLEHSALRTLLESPNMTDAQARELQTRVAGIGQLGGRSPLRP